MRWYYWIPVFALAAIGVVTVLMVGMFLWVGQIMDRAEAEMEKWPRG